MNDTRHSSNFPPLTAGQIRGLAASIREVFGSDLSRAEFTDKLLLFLEDVAGYESGEDAAALITSAWAEYNDRRQ